MLFDKETHSYWHNNIQYTSVTQFIERFKRPFNKYILINYAKKNNREVSDVEAQWDINSQISTNYGTAVHQGIECWIKYGSITKLPHIAKAVNLFANNFKRENLRSEVVVYSEELKLAGTIDLIEIIDKENKIVNIRDIKTNADLFAEPKGNMFAPFDHLQDSKLNGYALQLSFYKHLVESKGFTVNELSIEYWNGEKFETIKIEPIDITKAFEPIKEKTIIKI